MVPSSVWYWKWLVLERGKGMAHETRLLLGCQFLLLVEAVTVKDNWDQSQTLEDFWLSQHPSEPEWCLYYSRTLQSEGYISNKVLGHMQWDLFVRRLPYMNFISICEIGWDCVPETFCAFLLYEISTSLVKPFFLAQQVVIWESQLQE